MPSRTYIADLAPNQLVEGLFTIQNAQLGLTKTGKPYLRCLLADRTGRVPGRMWNASEQFVQTLPTNGFVNIEGQTQPYQGELQIIIRSIEHTTPRPEDLHHLLPSTEGDVERMFQQVAERLEGLSSPSLKALAAAYLEDRPLMARFRQAPAAMNLHHAYLGGLLEHTLNLMRLAEVVLPLYPQVNGQIVLFGLFLHDLGKCAELTWEAGFAYSDDGHLIGHIARGLIWLEDKARLCAERGRPVDEDVLRVLQHIIISHHGQPEFGALKVPATPEAIMVHLLDNVDAKVHMAVVAARGEAGRSEDLGGHFTEKLWALGTRIYRPDPLAHESGPSVSDGPPAAVADAADPGAPGPQAASTPKRPPAGRSGSPPPEVVAGSPPARDADGGAPEPPRSAPPKPSAPSPPLFEGESPGRPDDPSRAKPRPARPLKGGLE